MDNNNLNLITEKLNEEKWTRVAISSYTESNFKELDDIINQAMKEKYVTDLKKLCDEHLIKNNNSIIALYISSIISAFQHLVDDSNFMSIIELFQGNHKLQIVEYIAKRVLEYGENKYALRVLEDCYDKNKQDDKKIEIWERIVKVDFEEAKIVLALADLKKDSDLENAIKYYKIAFYRFISKKDYTKIKEIWAKLLEINPEDIDFYFNIEKKIYSDFDADKVCQFLLDLYNTYKQSEKWDLCIEISKRILSYNMNDVDQRKQLVECYRKKYSDHSKIDEYINKSDLASSFRRVYEAIQIFEKYISFDKGSFVFHNTWGTGIISSIENDELVIDFVKKRNHKMSLDMAKSCLTCLPKNHIWVLKSTNKPEKLKEKFKKDVEWGLKVLINSYNNQCSLKDMKKELVPSILTQNEWNSWIKEAKNKLLADNSIFGNLPNQLETYTIRETKITKEEKLFNQFKADIKPSSRIKVIREYINNVNDDTAENSCSLEAESFKEMLNYISGSALNFENTNGNSSNENDLALYLLLRNIISKFPFLNPGLHKNFNEIITNKTFLIEKFNNLSDSELKKYFIQLVKEYSDWDDIYVQLFPKCLDIDIIAELREINKTDKIKDIFKNILLTFKENREAFIWLLKHYQEYPNCEISKDDIILTTVHLLKIVYLELDNRYDVSNNKKYANQLETLLFKNELLNGYIKELFESGKESQIAKIYSMIFDIKGLISSRKNELKDFILAQDKNFKFYTTSLEKTRDVISRALTVLLKSFNTKTKELKYIIDVEIPANSKDIGIAMELGDLKENADYKAAKEKQTILNSMASKLQEDLEKAHIFKMEEVNVGQIGFGTVTKLFNKLTNKEESLTILGPWESDPSLNIISYMSPLGKELLNFKVNDDIDFIINEIEHSYKVIDIQAYDKIEEV